jgi:hypothetical protein
VVAYDLPGSAGARVIWGTGRANYQRTGVSSEPPAMVLRSLPSSRRIAYGGAASFTIRLSGAMAGTATLSAQIPAGLTGGLTSSTSGVPGQVTLNLTDTHSQSQAPGLWYSVKVTATNGSVVKSVVLNLLVDGRAVALPQVRR